MWNIDLDEENDKTSEKMTVEMDCQVINTGILRINPSFVVTIRHAGINIFLKMSDGKQITINNPSDLFLKRMGWQRR